MGDGRRLTDIELIKDRLVGKYLLGFMPLRKTDYPYGDWDNAVALYVGLPDKPVCYVLRSQNQDYSCYDSWTIEKSEVILERDDRYKTIGAIIDDVISHEITHDAWCGGDGCFQFSLITKVKTLRFGHHWIDCHYPESIWDAI